MNWQIRYRLFIATLLLYMLHEVLVMNRHINDFSLLIIPMLIAIPLYAYAYGLHQVIWNKKPVTKKLRILENVGYVLVFLLSAKFLYELYVMLFLYDEISFFMYNEMSLYDKIILTPYVVIIFDFAILIQALLMFRERKQVLGEYEYEESSSEDFEIKTLQDKSFYTQEERVKLCLSCTHRKLDTSVGMICGLTNEKPTFETFCNEYIEDEKVTAKYKELKVEEVSKGGFWKSWITAILFSILGFVRAGLTGFDDPFGIIFLILGIVWLLLAIFTTKK